MKFLILLMMLFIVSCSTPVPKPGEPLPPPVINPLPKLVKGETTFLLSYRQDLSEKDCENFDVIYVDMFDTPSSFIKACAKKAIVFCYYSTQYEDWRPDAKEFGRLKSRLDSWPGEKWVDPTDPKNLAVLKKRNDLALQKGCVGADFDNIDRKGHQDYVLRIFSDANTKGLRISHKNNSSFLEKTKPYVSVIQSEQCQQYNECETYYKHGLPHYNIEYESKHCKGYKDSYVVIKDVKKMDRRQTICK